MEVGGAPFPVDFWLYVVRVTLDFTSEQFAKDWPHPAVVKDQYAYWPSGGQVYSYQHANEMLMMVGSALKTADRLFPSTSCTEPQTAGADLGIGEFACYQPVDNSFLCDGVSDWHDRTSSWQDIARAEGWAPCTNKKSYTTTRKRKLATLEEAHDDISSTALAHEALLVDDDQ